MKKDAKKEKIADDKQTRYFMFAIIAIVVFIALLLSAKYFFPQKPQIQSYSYNNFIFTNVTGLWYTEILKAGTNDVYKVPLHFGPRDLQDISIEGDVNSFKNNTKVYITFEPNGTDFSFIALAASELSINLAQTLNITPVAACTNNESDACQGRPAVNCKEYGEPAIYLRYDNQTRIHVENNCIFLEGQGVEVVRAADRLLLKWFSVMP